MKVEKIKAEFETEYFLQFEGPERVGGFVAKFRDSKCKFWFGSPSSSGWELQNPSLCPELAALLTNISIKFTIRFLGLATEYSGYFMQKMQANLSHQWVLGIVFFSFLGNPKSHRDLIIPASSSDCCWWTSPCQALRCIFQWNPGPGVDFLAPACPVDVLWCLLVSLVWEVFFSVPGEVKRVTSCTSLIH